MATYKADPLLTGAHILDQQYQANRTTPNENDVDAEMFKDIRSSLGEKPRGWRAIASGFTQGLERGSKLSSLQERKKDLDKYNKVMNYFEEVNNNAIERKEWEERREQAKTSALPEVLSYIQNFSKYDPVTRQNVFNMALEQYNKSGNTNYKLDSIDGANPLKATISDGEETVSFDITNAFQDDNVLKAEAAKYMPSYQMQMQDQRQQQDLENRQRQEQLNIQRYNAESGRMGVEGKSGVSSTDQEFNKQLSKEEGKQVIQYRKDVIDDKKAADKLKQVVLDIKDAIQNGAATNEGQLSRIFNYLGTSYGGKTATATQIMELAAGNLLPRIKDAFGGRVTNTDLEFAEKHMLPGQHLSKEANLKFLDGLEKFINKKENEFKLSEDIIKQNQGQIPRDYIARLNSNSDESNSMVTIRNPVNGKIGSIPVDGLNKIKKP